MGKKGDRGHRHREKQTGQGDRRGGCLRRVGRYAALFFFVFLWRYGKCLVNKKGTRPIGRRVGVVSFFEDNLEKRKSSLRKKKKKWDGTTKRALSVPERAPRSRLGFVAGILFFFADYLRRVRTYSWIAATVASRVGPTGSRLMCA